MSSSTTRSGQSQARSKMHFKLLSCRMGLPTELGVFNDLIRQQHDHPLIKNKHVYNKNADHAHDFIMWDINDLHNPLRTIMHKYCVQNNLVTHPDST
jgi:hypothetical protein